MSNDILSMPSLHVTNALQQQRKNTIEYLEALPQWDISEHQKGFTIPGEIFLFLTRNHHLVHDTKAIYRYDQQTGRYTKFSDQTWLYFVKCSLTEDTSPNVSKSTCMAIKDLILCEYTLFRDFDQFEKEHPNLVGVANGIWDSNTRKVRPATADDLISLYYGFSYLDNCNIKQAPSFYNFVCSSLGYEADKRSTTLLCEVFGYTLSFSTKLRKLHIFYGVSGSGKSTALGLLQRILKQENVSSVPLHELSERYNLGELNGKRCNISTEISSKPLGGLSLLKILSASEYVLGEIKYQRAVPFEAKATLIFATNVMPEISAKERLGGDVSFFNRLNFVIFPVGTPSDKAIIDLEDKLWEERNVIFSLCLNAYADLVTRNFQLTEPPESVEFLNEYIRQEAKFSDFAQSHIEIVHGAKTSLADIMTSFQTYCTRNGFQYKGTSGEVKSYFFMKHPKDVVFKKLRFGRGSTLWGFLNVKLVREKDTNEEEFNDFKDEEYKTVKWQDSSLYYGGAL